nr:hypothetical protein Iba_chr10dCG3390 [Ipomoea batatas]
MRRSSFTLHKHEKCSYAHNLMIKYPRSSKGSRKINLITFWYPITTSKPSKQTTPIRFTYPIIGAKDQIFVRTLGR